LFDKKHIYESDLADIFGWIWDPIMGTEDVSSGGQGAAQASQLARASRGARVGTKAGRVVRIIRLVRLVKLYKQAQMQMNKQDKKKEGEEEEDVMDKLVREKQQREREEMEKKGGTPQVTPTESKVGKKLSDLTTRRVIILVLVMMFSVPMFSMETFIEGNRKSFEYGLKVIYLFNDDHSSAGFRSSFNTYLEKHKGIRTPLIMLSAGTSKMDTYNADTHPDDLRVPEKEVVALEESYEFASAFDLRPNTRLSACLGIAQTFFVTFVLAAGSLLFTQDATDLVISPIEKMMEKK